MTKQTTIDERIASALNGDPVSAATITALLRDAEAALEETSDIAAAEHANALNVGCADPNKAEQSSRAAALTRDRLEPVHSTFEGQTGRGDDQ